LLSPIPGDINKVFELAAEVETITPAGKNPDATTDQQKIVLLSKTGHPNRAPGGIIIH